MREYVYVLMPLLLYFEVLLYSSIILRDTVDIRRRREDEKEGAGLFAMYSRNVLCTQFLHLEPEA